MSQLMLEQKATPPYSSWHIVKVFLAQAGRFQQGELVDLNMITDLSHSQRGHLGSTLRFLGLVSNDRRATETLIRLANTQVDARSSIFGEILDTSYRFILDEYPDLSKLNLSALDSIFVRQGASGSTIRKCTTFFVELAKQAGMELPKVVEGRRIAHSEALPLAEPQIDQEKEQNLNSVEQKTLSNGNGAKNSNEEIKTINLKGAGSLTLALNVNLLELRGDDRAFVFSLIDQLQAYEDKATMPAG